MTTRSRHRSGVHTIASMSPRTWGQHKTYSRSVPPHEPCLTCGGKMHRHPRCLACRVLVGYGHSDASNPDGLCAGCRAQRDSGKVGAVLVAVAIEESKRWGT